MKIKMMKPMAVALLAAMLMVIMSASTVCADASQRELLWGGYGGGWGHRGGWGGHHRGYHSRYNHGRWGGYNRYPHYGGYGGWYGRKLQGALEASEGHSRELLWGYGGGSYSNYHHQQSSSFSSGWNNYGGPWGGYSGGYQNFHQQSSTSFSQGSWYGRKLQQTSDAQAAGA